MSLSVQEIAVQPSIDRIRLWRYEPWTFCEQVFGVNLAKWQYDFAKAFAPDSGYDRIAAKACKGPGKTGILAMLSWNFLYTRPHPRIACTSVTGDNLKSNLWPEMGKWRKKAPILSSAFEQTKTQIFNRAHRETWWMQARTWSRSANPEQQADTLAGLHADYVMAVLDEMGGIPIAVATAAEGVLATGKESKIIGGGNPTHRDGLLYFAAVEHADKWFCLHLTGDPDNPNRVERVKIKWAREQIEMWGLTSPYVQVNVMGEFPTEATDTLLALQWFEDAWNRWNDREGIPTSPAAAGLDVARYGTDSCVLTLRRGGIVDYQHQWHGQNTEFTANEAVRLMREYEDEFNEPIEAIAVDDIGVGGGVTDKLLARGENVVSVDFGSTASDNETFDNYKAELGFNIRNNWFKTQEIAINPELRTTRLMHEGTTLKYGFSPGRDRVRLESKDSFRTRNRNRSCDQLDSLILAFSIDAYGEAGGFASCGDGTAEDSSPQDGGMDDDFGRGESILTRDL